MRTIALSRLRLGLPVVYYAESDIKCDIPVFLFIATAPTEISTLSLHDALPICQRHRPRPIDRFGSGRRRAQRAPGRPRALRSEEHTSELQSRGQLVCRLLLEKKNHG